jgi:hypothetical protein|eukprot:g4707.t1
MDDEGKKKLGGCGCCVVFITAIILFACSFKTVEVNETCLQYGSLTREVEEEPTKNQGTVFIGIDQDFLCFPKTVLKLDYTGGNQLKARTKEGLLMGIDITIEYKLLVGSVKKLFDLTALEYENLYDAIAHSAMRNSASHFNAADILRSSGPFTLKIRELLEPRFNNFFATVSEVQVRQIQLPEDVQGKLQAVLNIGLQKDEATKKRDGEIANFEKRAQLSYLQVQQNRVTQSNAANRKLDVALVERKRALTQIATDFKQGQIQYEQDRNVRAEQANASVGFAKTGRDGKIQLERNKFEAAKVEAQDKIAISTSQAAIKRIEGQTDYDTLLIMSAAHAEEIALTMDAENTKFKSLKDGASFSSDNIVRHAYLDQLKDNHQDAKLFVDYKKVPMFVASEGNAEAIKSLNSDVIPGV